MNFKEGILIKNKYYKMKVLRALECDYYKVKILDCTHKMRIGSIEKWHIIQIHHFEVYFDMDKELDKL